MKLTKKIFFILVLIALSCTRTNYLLPTKYKLNKKITSKTSLDKITIYQIDADRINLHDLNSYPKRTKHSSGYKIQKWQRYNSINRQEQKRIFDIVKESNETSNNKHIFKLTELLQTNQDVYFSSLYSDETKDASGEPTRFYDTMYFINVKNKKLFEIQHIYDY